MAFGITELVVQGIIQEGLTNFRNNPHHLEYVLGRYSDNPFIAKKVGPNFIKNAMQMILKSDLTTRPYYTENMDSYPIMIFASSYSEDQQFLGDFGAYDTEVADKTGAFNTSPYVYASFDASSVSADTIVVSNDYKLTEKMFAGLYVFNSKTIFAKVLGIAPGLTSVSLLLDRKLPAKTALKNWSVSTIPKKVYSVTNSSMNAVTIQATLFTSGDPELHRVYAQVIRACFKKGRQQLEEYGIQNSSFAQEPMTVVNDTDLVFRTSFSMQAVETDTWIAQDITDYGQITLNTQIVSDDPDKEPV